MNSAGAADNAPPYVRDAINKLRGRAMGTRYGTAVTPTATPVAPTVNDTTIAKPGIVDRARAMFSKPAAAAPEAASVAARSGTTLSRVQGAMSDVGTAVSRSRSALSAATNIRGGKALAKGVCIVGRAAGRIAAPLVARAATSSRDARAGRATITRAALQNTVLSQDGREIWDGVLAKLGEQPGEFGVAGDIGSKMLRPRRDVSLQSPTIPISVIRQAGLQY